MNRAAVVLLILTALASGALGIRRTSDDDYQHDDSPYDDERMDDGSPDEHTHPHDPNTDGAQRKPLSGEQAAEEAPKMGMMAAMAPVIAIMFASKTLPALDCQGSMIPMLVTVFFYPRAVAAVAQSFQINMQRVPDSTAAAINSAVAIGVFATVAIVGKSLGHFQPVGQDKIGTKAGPVNELDYVQGAAVDVTRNGSVKVVEFWASWCGPCKQAIPHLNQLWKQLVQENSAEKVQFVGVNQGEDKEKVQQFIEEMGDKMTYSVALDPKSSLSGAYPTAGIPHVYVVDMDGLICWTGHPASAEMPAAIRAALKGVKKTN